MEVSTDLATPRRGLPKKIIALSVVLVLVILVLFFFMSSSNKTIIPTVAYQYKIFVTHNGQPLNFGYAGIAFNNFNYGMDFYKNSDVCPVDYIETGSVINSPNYTFDRNTIIGNKKLNDYEKSAYAFDIYVSAQPSDETAIWSAVIEAKDSSNSSINFNTLPKLQKDLSLTLDIPIFTLYGSNYYAHVSNGSVNIHAEMTDSGRSNDVFYCRLFRNYDSATDANLSQCPQTIGFETSQQCVQNQVCGEGSRVTYMSIATRNGNNVDCTFPISKLTVGKSYKVRISTKHDLGQDLVQNFYTDFIGNITVPNS